MDYLNRLRELEKMGSMRTLKPLSGRDGCRVVYKGRKVLNLSSNDYLGVAGSKELQREFYSFTQDDDFLEKFGLGAASSRLLTGDNPVSHQLEEDLQNAYQKDGCLLFNSGYHANIGILPVLTTKKDLILSDKLNHASIHDGLQLSRATHKRFRHCDYDHLLFLLEEQRDRYEKVIIATESVFSMDGDEADLRKLVDIKKGFDCMLYVDEAHGVGVYGEKGLGKSEEQGVLDDVDLFVGTFGKAYGSVGAFLACSQEIKDYLVNHSRSLIFTTALPPVITSWNHFVFKYLLGLNKKRESLKLLSDKLRNAFSEKELKTAGSTNIVPVIIGDNRKTVELAEIMQKYGYLIFAVRPPTVPEGTARFRLSLTADMIWEDIERLPELLSRELRV